MYYEAVSQCARMLKNIETWLEKAEKHAAAKKFDVNILIAERLAPDMKPFIYQVRQSRRGLAFGTSAAQARGQRTDDRRCARPHSEDCRFRRERERGAVCGRK